MRLGDWTGFDIDKESSVQLVARMRAAWDAAGIVHSGARPFTGYPTVHGKVPEGQPPSAIFVKTQMADQHRPEQLS